MKEYTKYAIRFVTKFNSNLNFDPNRIIKIEMVDIFIIQKKKINF